MDDEGRIQSERSQGLSSLGTCALSRHLPTTCCGIWLKHDFLSFGVIITTYCISLLTSTIWRSYCLTHCGRARLRFSLPEPPLEAEVIRRQPSRLRGTTRIGRSTERMLRPPWRTALGQIDRRSHRLDDGICGSGSSTTACGACPEPSRRAVVGVEVILSKSDQSVAALAANGRYLR